MTIDHDAVVGMVDWYIDAGVAGLFAVCQSSEMFQLSMDERVELASTVVRRAAGRVPVIAAGVLAEDPLEQAEQAARIHATGVEAVVLLTNRFAADRDDGEWIRGIETFLKTAPDRMPLGLYECPYPAKRLLSLETVGFVAATRRFSFLKDTSCDARVIEERISTLAGSPTKLFNANAATLLQTLRHGAAGYSGVMANVHPDLYVWMVENWMRHPTVAERVQAYLGALSLFERGPYPINAKYAMSLLGVDIAPTSRRLADRTLTQSEILETEQVVAVGRYVRPAEWIGIQ